MSDLIYKKERYDIVGYLIEVLSCVENGLFYFPNNPNAKRN